jgi:carboxyl-terminal processing protease
MKDIKTRKRILCIIVAIVIFLLGLGGGFVIGRLTLGGSALSYKWAIKTITENYYEDLSEDDLINYSLSQISDNILDPYSEYYTKEEYKRVSSSNSGSRSGIGISYSYLDTSFGSGVYVSSIVGNSPAYYSGLKVGTFVTGASYAQGDETVTVEFSQASDFSSFVTERGTGESFTLITDKGDYQMAKSDYTASYCFMSTNAKAWECSYQNKSLVVSQTTQIDRVISYLPDGVAYLSLSQFYGNSANEMAQLFSKFNEEGCDTLILDLRNNGGGYVDVMRKMSSLFVSNRADHYKVAMTAKYKSGKEDISNIIEFASDSCLLPATTKVYVLANNGTASASEALIGVLVSNSVVDYSDIYISDFSDEYVEFSGTTKNKRTYGKGIMQTPFTNFWTGEVLKLTTAQIYWPNGKTIHNVGLTEGDGCKTVYAEWTTTYGDKELQRVVNEIWG